MLNLAELLALADAMPEQHRALTLLSGFCGLRFGTPRHIGRRGRFRLVVAVPPG